MCKKLLLKLISTKPFKQVCEVLCNVYPRWDNPPMPMSEFSNPW